MENQPDSNPPANEPDNEPPPPSKAAPEPSAVTSGLKSESAERPQDCCKKYLHPPEKNCKRRGRTLEIYSAGVSTATLIAAVFVACIYNGQLKEMRSSTDATNISAKAAEKSAKTADDALHIDQRAWVGIQNIIPTTMSVGQPVEATFSLTNSGKTPARNVYYIIMVTVTRFAIGDALGFEKSSTEYRNTPKIIRGVFFPNGIYSVKAGGEADANTADISEVNAGQLFIYLMGEIHYDDVFGKPHTTWFCWRFNPKTNTYESQPGAGNNDAD